jgi:hypothetical protein
MVGVWVASPFVKGEGEGFIGQQALPSTAPSPQSSPLLQGRGGKNGCGFVGTSAGFIKVLGMDLIALLLKRPFHTGVC